MSRICLTSPFLIGLLFSVAVDAQTSTSQVSGLVLDASGDFLHDLARVDHPTDGLVAHCENFRPVPHGSKPSTTFCRITLTRMTPVHLIAGSTIQLSHIHLQKHCYLQALCPLTGGAWGPI
jgi:hypothetical protein